MEKMKRLFAIAVIWLGCAVAWVVLGATVLFRTEESSGDMQREVHGLWGPPGVQAPPSASFLERQVKEEVVLEQTGTGDPTKKTIQKESLVEVPVELDASNVDVSLALEHRRKGLMWFPTYLVSFRGEFTFENDSPAAQEVTVTFPLRSSEADRSGESGATFDAFTITDSKGKPVSFRIDGGQARFVDHFEKGAKKEYTISYRTRGTSSWRYALTQGTGRVENLRLVMHTNFADVDFPADSISPTRHGATPEGWQGEWEFQSLISTAPIGIDLPQLLNPGPLASKVTFFAPISLLFFFFVIAVLAQARGREMHPMHYFLLGCAFFAFHLLFAYLVDHLPLVKSFGIASAVSVFLVVSYARLFVGWQFALREMALAQLLYLVLFSATFFWSGFTGLAITVGAILTLFFVMQVTGRVQYGPKSGNLEPHAPLAD
jgi:hypothetical protein